MLTSIKKYKKQNKNKTYKPTTTKTNTKQTLNNHQTNYTTKKKSPIIV